MKKGKRVFSLDVIRITAIVFVVFIHSYENYYSFNSTSGYLIGRIGVPLFLALSGATMVDREYSEKYIHSHMKRILYFYLVSVLWLFLYRINTESVFDNIIHSLGLVCSAKHLWYLNLLIVIYLSFPFLSYLRGLETKTVEIIFGIVILLAILQDLNFVNINNGFLYAYVYLIWGFLCYARNIFEKVSAKKLFLVFLSLFIISIVALNLDGVRLYYQSIGRDILWYSSPMVMFPSLAVFPLLLKINNDNDKEVKLATVMSKCTFGVYIVHLFVIGLISPYIQHINEMNGKLGTLILCVFTLFTSFALSYILGKIPLLKKTILQ